MIALPNQEFKLIGQKISEQRQKKIMWEQNDKDNNTIPQIEKVI